MLTLRFYSTLGCHLCDLALQLVEQSIHCEQISIDLVDIADDDQLMERYGIRIPVLTNIQSQNEIGWPFSQEEFDAWFVKESNRAQSRD